MLYEAHDEYGYSVDLDPPLVLEGGKKYWVEIRNSAKYPCQWWWETAPPGNQGNTVALYDDAGDGYDAEDLVPYDLAFCVFGVPSAQDCNSNGINDSQDILGATSLDCQANGIPDECDDDRNFNGIPDDCDIIAGTSKDLNFNGVPDEADCLTTPGDLDGDCDLDLDDLAVLVTCLGRTGGDAIGVCACADFDGNASIDMTDYLDFSVGLGIPDVGCRIIPEDSCPDNWATAGVGRSETFYDFGVHGPIPADFFGAGSDPFAEIVTFAGTPADPNGVHGEVDTQIQHGPVIFDPMTGIAQTSLSIRTLELISEIPITVTYDDGGDPEEWLVVVGLSPHDPGEGQLIATLDAPDANAGAYDATVYVQPAFLFVKLQDLIDEILPECVDIRILDTGEPQRGRSAMPPIELSFTDQSFVRVADPDIVELINVPDCAQGNFVPGVLETSRGGRTAQQLTCTGHYTPGEEHYFCPPECEGDDVCKYYKTGRAVPFFCSDVPSFPPPPTLGHDCPDGFCFPVTVKFKRCPGGGFALQRYGNPICVSRESTCDGACCNDQGHCAMSTNALCDGDYKGNNILCDPNPCATCGNSVVEGSEECDDGDTNDNNDCTNACEDAECGDGIIWNQGAGDEECDDGDTNDNNDCTNACEDAECGDGIIWNQGAGNEECDDGNTAPGDGCSSACLVEGACCTAINGCTDNTAEADCAGDWTAGANCTWELCAGCGTALSAGEWATLHGWFENLVRDHTSKQAGQSIFYNCIAWSVGRTDIWINDSGPSGTDPDTGVVYVSIDLDYGNGNGVLDTSELDAFYADYGFGPTGTGYADADVAYYSGYHGASRETCPYGYGIRYSSKLGQYIRIEHHGPEVEGMTYGTANRFYIRP